MAYQIKHLPEKGRFETDSKGYTAYCEYNRRGDVMTILHTIVPPPIQNEGVGSELMQSLIDFAEEHALEIIPSCYFAQVWLKRHPEYQKLVR